LAITYQRCYCNENGENILHLICSIQNVLMPVFKSFNLPSYKIPLAKKESNFV
jgi:hypothetical protein